MKINGITQLGTVYLPFSMLINKIWRKSSNDLYVVGNNGNVAYYQNGVWNKIESGTDLPINDIWGSYNSDTGENEILCVASNQFVDQGTEVIKIVGDEAVKINNSGLSWALNTVWFIPGREYFIGGDGLYTAKHLGDEWIRANSMPPYYKTGVRGSNFNDIVIRVHMDY